jgi:predicted deacylase
VRIHDLGDGPAETAVVAGVHGDEPCGVRAVERLLASDLGDDLTAPVKLVVANEAACDAGERFVDEDLNRAFPGDPDADSHEARLAHDLSRELRGCTTLALHSTRSYADPFAVVRRVDAVARGVCPHLPVDAVVETDAHTEGRLVAHPGVVEVECGLQGTDAAADNAVEVTRAFLRAAGALPGGDDRRDVPTFRLDGPIPKPPAAEYEVFAENFARVAAGEPFAAADGETLTAETSFHPVLLSADGYESQFGYAAERVDDVG